MVKKKTEELAVDEIAAAEAAPEETVAAAGAEAEEKPAKKSRPRKTAAEAEDDPVEGVAAAADNSDARSGEKVEKTASGEPAAKGEKRSKRAEKVGIVWSDKMTKTVVVRVDRQVKHPIYRKYVKRKKKFMAHDETGATIGDKVRIVETRPLSARKRWRVVEIIQKALK